MSSPDDKEPQAEPTPEGFEDASASAVEPEGAGASSDGPGGDSSDSIEDEATLSALLTQVEELEHEVAALRRERDELQARVDELERAKQTLEEEVQSASEMIERLGAEFDAEIFAEDD